MLCNFLYHTILKSYNLESLVLLFLAAHPIYMYYSLIFYWLLLLIQIFLLNQKALLVWQMAVIKFYSRNLTFTNLGAMNNLYASYFFGPEFFVHILFLSQVFSYLFSSYLNKVWKASFIRVFSILVFNVSILKTNHNVSWLYLEILKTNQRFTIIFGVMYHVSRMGIKQFEILFT